MGLCVVPSDKPYDDCTRDNTVHACSSINTRASIFDLSIFVVAITGGIFLIVGGLRAVALYRFRSRKGDPVAFMWVFGSLVFLVPAINLTTRFLANGRPVNEKTGLEKARALAR